jgi:hypothetical protein
MRSMMIRRDPLSIFEELLQPMKYGPRMYENDVGTKDSPSIIVRSHMVERKYKAWREPDGSYHEELISDGDGGDVTENYGGTG